MYVQIVCESLASLQITRLCVYVYVKCTCFVLLGIVPSLLLGDSEVIFVELCFSQSWDRSLDRLGRPKCWNFRIVNDFFRLS